MKRLLVVFCVVLSCLVIFSGLTFAFSAQDRQLAIMVGQKLSVNATARGGGTAFLGGNLQWQLENIFRSVAREALRIVDLPYTLHILSSTEPDAWSYCDGSVYITMGVVRQLEYSHEYAALFGHLLAHVVRKHHVGSLLETAEGRSFLEDIAHGRVGVTQSDLGKFSVYLLALSYSRSEEEEADALGRDLAYRAGYGSGGLETAYSKIAAYSKTCRFFQTHPHPNVQPYSPDVYPDVHVEGKVITDVGSEKTEVHVPLEVFVDVGQYPFNTTACNTVLHYNDSPNGGPGDDYNLTLNQKASANVNVLGLGLALRIIEPVYVSGWFGFGLGCDVFKRSTSESVSIMEFGVGVKLGDENTNMKVGTFWANHSFSSQVDTVKPEPGGTGADEMIIYTPNGTYRIPHGTPIIATCNGSGFGAYLTLDIPISKSSVSVSLTAKYQSVTGKAYRFSARDEFNRAVEIPYTGQYPKPFDATGMAICGGIKVRF
jgi:Zn-dependent protease with chaperone function